jgi:hypothetical protein
MKLVIYFSKTNQLLISQRGCLSYNRVYDLSPLIYYYFDIIMTIESEGSESSEGIIDNNTLSNKQNDDAII